MPVYLLTHSLKGLPVGTSFAAFTGIGAIGISISEVWHFQESGPPARLLSMAPILTGIVALKIAENLTLEFRKEHFHGTTALC